jgi:hypothetical protein
VNEEIVGPQSDRGDGAGASEVDRRAYLQGAAASAAALALPVSSWASSALPADDLDAIRREIEKRHDESVRRLQTWIIKQASIAAENRGMNAATARTLPTSIT